MLEPVSLVAPPAALLMALFTAHLLSKRFGVPSEAGRFVTIDGLRGYLAFFVFLMHSCAWYFYLRNGGVWQPPPSHLYTHFGQSSVAFFFMITGFLFSNKIIEGRRKPIDWLHLYVSRVMRLVPLYLFAMLLLFTIVAIISQAALKVPVFQLLVAILRWLTFTVAGEPDLNGVNNTWFINAGVIWSLPYEWLFYFCLPLVSIAVGRTPPLAILFPCTLVALLLALHHHITVHLATFSGGITAAVLVRYDRFRNFARTPLATVIALGCVAFTVFRYSGFQLPAILPCSLAFALVAGGNSLFGALKCRLSLVLGEMAYSIYLLHGTMLFCLFHFVIGQQEGAALSASSHWLFIILMTPILITVCFFSFRLIEQPAMERARLVTEMIRFKTRRNRLAAG